MSLEDTTNYGELSESEFNLWLVKNDSEKGKEEEEKEVKPIKINLKCKCCEKSIIPLDTEYFDNIIPSISTLFKNKYK